MTDSANNCKANETSACCCVDISAVIDNSNCNVPYEASFVTQQEAEEKLAKLIKIARDIESDPCRIDHTIEQIGSEIKLSANFNFCCATESMIFQFKLR